MTRRHLAWSAMVPFLLFATLVESGCVVVPLKLKTRFESSPGTKIAMPKDAIVPGSTTREEIDARLSGIEVESGIPGLYWGRVRKSSWGLGFATLLPTVYAGGGREWGLVNILATFDSQDRVSRYGIVGRRELQAELSSMVAAAAPPPLSLSEALRLEDLSDSTTRRDVELTPTVATVTTTRSKKGMPSRSVAVVPLRLVDRVQIGGGGEDVARIDLQIHFARKTEAGKKVSLRVAPRTAATVVRWLAQVRPDLLGLASQERPGQD